MRLIKTEEEEEEEEKEEEEEEEEGGGNIHNGVKNGVMEEKNNRVIYNDERERERERDKAII